MRVFVIAGEPSGDKLGGALMAGLRELRPDIEFLGVGGALMAEQGLSSLFAMSELSVMGVAEILPKYRALKARIRQCSKAVIDAKPDVLITIDSPDFCLRVARLVKAKSDVRTIHYVAPSVWAWRAGRAKKMAHAIDHVLALLPFEPPLMQAAGMGCDFVGHPVAGEPVVNDSDVQIFRQTHGIGDAPLVLVLPGSRHAEINRLAPIFGPALHQFVSAVPDARLLVVAASSVANTLNDATKNWPVRPRILDPRALTPNAGEAQKRIAFRAADIALAASGTVSLELAAASTPMVIAYDMNWLSWQIMSRMAKIDTVTLANLVTQTRTIPEFLGPRCQPEPIATALIEMLQDQTKRDAQIDIMRQTMLALGRGGEAPGLRAARAVLNVLENPTAHA